MGIKETASTFCISRNTVRKYVRLFLSSGKSIEQLISLSDVQLDELFGCTASRHREPSPRRIELEALLRGSRNLVGITIQLSDSEEEEFFVGYPMLISPEKFDFGIERFGCGI